MITRRFSHKSVFGKILFVLAMGASNNAGGQDAEKKLAVTRLFDAPLAQVWNAWSKPDEVMKWWGPTGFTSPSCKMDFREGGTTLVCMRAPKEFGGQDMYNTWSYKKIVPMEYIEYVFDFADKDGNKIAPASIGLPADLPTGAKHTVSFRDAGNGKTEMIMTEFGYLSDEHIKLSRMGLDQCLDKMAASFQNHSKPTGHLR